MPVPTLESERLILHPLSLLHLSQEYVNWLNDEEASRYISYFEGHTTTFNELKNYLEDVEKKDILFWGIHTRASGKHIGNIKIDPVVKKFGLCEYGILIGDKSEWGKGYAKEASQLIIDYCFNVLNLRKMTLGVTACNESAVKLYKNLGFEIEGIFKNQEFHFGKYQDGLRMSLFNPSYTY
tara:strand:+ start:184 stop:726 length:543 start_codon:yes stop_codon:yes gene_type:complete